MGKATKDAGLINIVTSTAEGPYVWSASSKDARDIDWSLVDYFVPQMYGAAGTHQLSGKNMRAIGKMVPISPMCIMLRLLQSQWTNSCGVCQQVRVIKPTEFGGSGCIEWA